jgi:hypothetical protein
MVNHQLVLTPSPPPPSHHHPTTPLPLCTVLPQVIPMEELNLHLTGDIHAISAANSAVCVLSLVHSSDWQNKLGVTKSSG